jgi:hypothetical protein
MAQKSYDLYLRGYVPAQKHPHASQVLYLSPTRAPCRYKFRKPLPIHSAQSLTSISAKNVAKVSSEINYFLATGVQPDPLD